MRLKKILIFCLLFILVLFSTSCQQDKQKELISLTSYNSLISLNDLSVEISDLLSNIEKKDYIKAADVILTIHETWDQLYPYIYISGLTVDMSSSFSKDLNAVSEIIFSYSTESKKREAEIEATKALIYLDSITSEKEIIQMQENMQNENPSDSNEKTSENQSNDKNDLEMMDKNKLSYQNSSLKEENRYQQLNKIILPEEVLAKTYPEITFDQSDAYAYAAAVQLTKHLADFYYIINESDEGQLIYMKYLFQDIEASAHNSDWNRLDQDIIDLTTLWTELRQVTGEDTAELVIKLDQNIYEITEISQSRNVEIIKVKSKIGIKNVEELLNK